MTTDSPKINPPATHIVTGSDASGKKVYYTGRAGEWFISPDRAQAFIGWYESGAQNVATRLNRGTPFHGVTFRAEAA